MQITLRYIFVLCYWHFIVINKEFFSQSHFLYFFSPEITFLKKKILINLQFSPLFIFFKLNVYLQFHFSFF